ncbi:hypothetical protein [Cupriavidus sp. WS]|uniref:hypothetical protein n=1 Tax=Cupriavidus sp. WS TaxID=1312922 RepID=UPI0012DFB272|nr:hypothetical protein [Cupriavidus sp. WS]
MDDRPPRNGHNRRHAIAMRHAAHRRAFSSSCFRFAFSRSHAMFPDFKNARVLVDSGGAIG